MQVFNLLNIVSAIFVVIGMVQKIRNRITALNEVQLHTFQTDGLHSKADPLDTITNSLIRKVDNSNTLMEC